MCNNSTIPVQPRAPQYLVVTSTILYVIIFFTGVVGNILVIVTIRSSRTLKTSVNMYLLNLCLADLLVLLVCMPTALAEIYTKEAWYFGGLMCMYGSVYCCTRLLFATGLCIFLYRYKWLLFIVVCVWFFFGVCMVV